MKKHFLTFLLIALSFSACRSLRVRDFHTTQNLPERLPRLSLLVHERSFLEAFDFALDRDVVSGPYFPEPWEAYQVTDQALEDVFHVLDNDLNENINLVSRESYGHARFKLLFYKRRNSGWGWTVASISTFFIPNFLGMPVSTHRVEMEVQMEILDADGKMLGRYTAPGKGKVQVAMYYGYESSIATRKANLLALQNAMSNIKKRLEANAHSLSSQLEAAGTLRILDGK